MKLICITPVDQIPDFKNLLQSKFETSFINSPTKNDLRNHLKKKDIDIIFTNPNQQGFKIDKSLLDGTIVKYICTASTGTNHIDIDYCNNNGINVISITKEIDTLRLISSTAELAFCLLLSTVRKLIPASESTKESKWSWEPFLGRQVKDLKIGVVGYGRLGTMFSHYAKSFGAEVIIYDPYVDSTKNGYKQINSLIDLFKECDVISLHVHVSKETKYMINKNVLLHAKQNCILINTSRGEIVNEIDVFNSLQSGQIQHYACDVLEKEFESKVTSPLLGLDKNKVTITPHIGGSTIDAQKIAYKRAFELLIQNIENSHTL